MNVLIVEDAELVADGLAATLLKADGFHVARASTLSEALETPIPDVVILDLGLPDACPLETVSLLRDGMPEARVLVITVAFNSDLAIWCLQGGALGFIDKLIKPHALLRAVETVADGDPFLTPELADALAHRLNPKDKSMEQSARVLEAHAEGLGLEAVATELNLSRRQVVAAILTAVRTCGGSEPTRSQMRVLVGISLGLSNEQIALAVGTGRNTVERHIRNIRLRCGVPEWEVRALAIWAVKAHATCQLTIAEHSELYRA